jgi:hypothetical protein
LARESRLASNGAAITGIGRTMAEHDFASPKASPEPEI